MPLNASPLEQLDLRSLRLLLELLQGHTLSAVARHEGISQAALSNQLARWRVLLGDPLLVRAGRGLQLSDHGAQLLTPLRALLDQAKFLPLQTHEFIPAQARGHLRIGASDYMDPRFLPAIAATCLSQAPQIALSIDSLSQQSDYAQQLAQGELDMVLANWQQQAAYLRRSSVFKDETVCLLAPNHPLIKRGLQQREYFAAQHIAPTAPSPVSPGFIDTALAQMGLARHIAVRCAYFSTMLGIVARSSLILTTGRRYAHQAVKTHGLVMLPCPVKFPPMQFSLLWHERTHHSPAHAWLRQIIIHSKSELL
jgi:DNA-binding transcriptional LysR family regulator